MKFSEQWLREWVDPAISTEELAHRLTMSGLEVESIEKVAPDFSSIVVGKITHVEKHPNADKLKICQVDVGGTNLLTIVCGAQNARENLKVPTALVGAVLPNQVEIKQAKLRGAESFGMLCSAKELGLEESVSGLLELPDDAPLGQNIRDYLMLDDYVIDVAVTPNRGDCLSILGLAREVAAENNIDFQMKEINPVQPTLSDHLTVQLEKDSGCHYVGRVIREMNSKAKTPLWMQERLRRSGIRSIHVVVDILNYVMLELGQPMHAFDLEKLSGPIQVRRARENEKIKLLTGEAATLTPIALVIADNNGPVALAGVMGGLDSSVTETTQHVFLESAYFDQSRLIRSSRSGTSERIQTDASYHFERGVDDQLQRKAMERATELILHIAGGKAGPVVEEADSPRPQREIVFDLSSLQAIVGVEMEEATIRVILKRLGFVVKHQKGNVWTIVVPSFRFDVPSDPYFMGLLDDKGQPPTESQLESIATADMAEEIARIYGYDNIPMQTLSVPLSVRKTSSRFEKTSRIRMLLKDSDYHEVVTYSFVDPEKLKWFEDINVGQPSRALTLVNPISTTQSVMRTTLWVSLVETLLYNLNRQIDRVKIFELGSCYMLENAMPREELVLSGLMSGAVHPETWGEKKRTMDFYDLKGDVEAILKLNHLPPVDFVPVQHRALHPGKSAALLLNGRQIGILGCVHPQVAERFDLPHSVGLFELKLNELLHDSVVSYQPISRFPSIRRDLAFVLDAKIPEGMLEQAIREEAGPLLAKLVVFDVYQGPGIDNGKKSIALGLTFQQLDRTLNVEEVNEVIDRVVKLLQNKFNVMLRD